MMKEKIKSFVIVIIILVALLAFGSDYFCIFKRVLGIPCPTCGLTRSYEYLLRGDISNAFFYHPLFLLFPIIVVIIGAYNVDIIKKILSKKIIIVIIGFLILGTWVVRMALFFPYTPPMDFNNSSLVVIFYRSIITLF